MIFDQELMLSDGQAITTTAVSTNVLDMGAAGTPIIDGPAASPLARDHGKGNPIPLHIQVTTAFAGGTSLKVAVQTDDNSGFSSAKTVLESEIVLTASLVAGYVFPITMIPRTSTERYIRLNYTVDGTMTAGNVIAGVTTGAQENPA